MTQTPKQKRQQKKKAVRLANLRTSSIGNAICGISNLFKNENIDLDTLGKRLATQQENVENGKMQGIESMLLMQAQTLQALFHYSVERISYTDTLTKFQAYTDLAIKANNACRKTLLALDQIKHPSKATFIKQQNNAVNQQINHGTQDALEAQNKKNSEKKQVNELLNEVHHETLDIGRENQTIEINSPVEALAESGRKNA